MKTTNNTTKILDIAGLPGQPEISRDGNSVVIGCGSAGYIRLTPSHSVVDAVVGPAVEVEFIGRRNGKVGYFIRQAKDAIRAAGYEA